MSPGGCKPWALEGGGGSCSAESHYILRRALQEMHVSQLDAAQNIRNEDPTDITTCVLAKANPRERKRNAEAMSPIDREKQSWPIRRRRRRPRHGAIRSQSRRSCHQHYRTPAPLAWRLEHDVPPLAGKCHFLRAPGSRRVLDRRAGPPQLPQDASYRALLAVINCVWPCLARSGARGAGARPQATERANR